MKNLYLFLLFSFLSLQAQPDSSGATLLTDKQVQTLFPQETLKEIGVTFPIRKVYAFQDKLGKQYLIISENNTNPDKATSIKAFNVLLKEDTPPQVLWTITDAIDDTEQAMWFYTRYISLTDLNNDGYIDPIVLYGTESQYGEPYEENRLKFIIYYLGKKTAIRHQNSSLDDGRHTQIDRSYYKLPLALKKKIRSIVATLEEREHALFNTETIKELKK
ncbi:M949_RS01915 family surface polysaccharide biosynthesis protein [Capnocytophaga sp.]